MMRNMSIAYDYATFRRPSQVAKEADLEQPQTATSLTSSQAAAGAPSETPTTPIPPEITVCFQNLFLFFPSFSFFSIQIEFFFLSKQIDDEFNLPISLALFILIAYILCGATVYSIFEEKWTFFQSCYFVFVSMSTIGFGDYVPEQPIRMMISIIYFIFGLSLTSMCINVIQEKMSDSFRRASAKIGATIGLSLAEEEALSSQNVSPHPDEELSVHSYGRKDDDQQKLATMDSGVYDNAQMRDGRFVIQPSNEPSSIDTVDRKIPVIRKESIQNEPEQRMEPEQRREPPSNLTVRSPPKFPSTGNVYCD